MNIDMVLMALIQNRSLLLDAVASITLLMTVAIIVPLYLVRGCVQAARSSSSKRTVKLRLSKLTSHKECVAMLDESKLMVRVYHAHTVTDSTTSITFILECDDPLFLVANQKNAIPETVLSKRGTQLQLSVSKGSPHQKHSHHHNINENNTNLTIEVTPPEKAGYRFFKQPKLVSTNGLTDWLRPFNFKQRRFWFDRRHRMAPQPVDVEAMSLIAVLYSPRGDSIRLLDP